MALMPKLGKKSRNTLEGSVTEVPVDIPERHLYAKCPGCNRIADIEEVAGNADVCPRCGHHMRISARRRIELTADPQSFVEWDADLASTNFLEFPGYAQKLEKAHKKSGEIDAVICGSCRIEGMPCALFVMNGDFMMGSMGSVVGEKITRLFEKASEQHLPVVGFTVSGGARMQEGTTSLMQMAKVSAAIRRFSDAGGLYVTVLTDPTSGGVTASFAMEGDIILAEPGALVAFAGPRVIEQTIHRKLPAGFQSAEFQLDHGFVDRIVPRADMRDVLGYLLALHADSQQAAAWTGRQRTSSSNGGAGSNGGETSNLEATAMGVAAGIAAAARKAGTTVSNVVSNAASGVFSNGDAPSEQPSTEAPASAAATAGTGTAHKVAPTAYERVRQARDTSRPTALTLIGQVFSHFFELHGDRSFRDDEAVVGGIAQLGNMPVTVIGTDRGSNLKERVARNFGSAHPEGYRKALRLMQQAEKFGRPVVCLIDTSGAYCGIDAEERGQGQAIAQNLIAMAGLKVPIISVVIGEGGSGGALALGLADRVYMLENAVYSVISPEGCASILYKDANKAAEAAEALKLTAHDLEHLGIVDGVIPEDTDEHTLDPSALAQVIQTALHELTQLGPDELVDNRYTKYRSMGVSHLCCQSS